MSFLPVCGSNFATAGCVLLELPARPVSAVGLYIYRGVAAVYFHITLVVWSNQAQISPELRWSLPFPALPALTHPSPTSLSPGGRTLTSVSHLFNMTLSPSISNPLKSPQDSWQRFVLSLLQSYSSGHFSVKEIRSHHFIVSCMPVFMLWLNYYGMTLFHCWNKGNSQNIDLAHQNEHVLHYNIVSECVYLKKTFSHYF